MNYRLKLSACAFALAFGVPAVASAQGLNGLNYTLDGHYGQFDVPGPGSSVDDWGFGGAVSAPVADAFSLQGNAAFDRHSNSGAHLSTWNLAGSGLFNFGQGRVAGTLGYNTYRGAGTNFDAFAYGVGAEFYAADQLTIAVRGGGISPNHGIKDGSYFGGALTGYVMPDLGVTGTLNYVQVGGTNATDYGIKGEWLVSETTPIGVYASYSSTDPKGPGGNVTNWMIGLTFYSGTGSLVQHQRTGTANFIAGFGGLTGLIF